jgi:hypothetical protein
MTTWNRLCDIGPMMCGLLVLGIVGAMLAINCVLLSWLIPRKRGKYDEENLCF